MLHTKHFLELLDPEFIRFLGVLINRPLVGVVINWNEKQTMSLL